MASKQELVDIVLKVAGVEDVKRLKNEIAQEEEAIKKLYQQLGNSPAAHAQLAAASQKAAQNIQALNQNLSSAEKLVKQAGTSTVNGGRAFLEFSRAAEDAQYGVAGVLNNIPGLIQALGGGAGLMGVISVTVVAVYQLYKHWDDVKGLFSDTSPIKSTADELKGLEAQTKRTYEETVRLINLKEKDKRDKAGASAFSALPDVTPEEEERGKAFGEAVGKAGGKSKVVDAILRSNPDMLEGLFTDAEKKKIEDARKRVETLKANPVAGHHLKDAENELDAAQLEAGRRARDQFEGEFAKASIGKDAIVRWAIDLLPPELRKEFLDVPNAPEKKAEKKAQEAKDKADADTNREADEEARIIDEDDAANLKRFNAAKAKNRKKTDELNRQGEENEKFALEQAKEFSPDVYRQMIADDPAKVAAFDREQENKAKQAAMRGVQGQANAAKLGLDQASLALDVMSKGETKGGVFGGGPAAFHDMIQNAILGQDPTQLMKDQLEVLRKLLDINERQAEQEIVAKFGPDQ